MLIASQSWSVRGDNRMAVSAMKNFHGDTEMEYQGHLLYKKEITYQLKES